MIYFTRSPKSRQKLFFKSDKSKKELEKFAIQCKDHPLFKHGSFYEEAHAKMGLYKSVHSYDFSEDSYIEKLKKAFRRHLTYIPYNDWESMAIEVQKNLPSSNEADIREATKKFLAKEHDIAFIQDEYTHTNLPVRADILLASKEEKIISVEIKSDKDTFVRLEKQLTHYLNFSHRVYVALDEKHLASYLSRFDKYNYDSISVLVFEEGQLRQYKKGYESSRRRDFTQLLWKDEYKVFLNDFEGNFKRLSTASICNIIEKIYSVEEWYQIAEVIFIQRYLQNKKFSICHLIQHKEHKQTLINELLSNKKGTRK